MLAFAEHVPFSLRNVAMHMAEQDRVMLAVAEKLPRLREYLVEASMMMTMHKESLSAPTACFESLPASRSHLGLSSKCQWNRHFICSARADKDRNQ